jgi:hypothetical protein
MPSGAKYRLSLIPQLDAGDHVVVLELELRGRETEPDNSNFLDTGKLHGYQPYFFAASDFARGIQKSVYGQSRVIELHRLGMKMRITVGRVSVKPIEHRSSDSLQYEFRDLVIQVTTESVAGRGPK